MGKGGVGKSTVSAALALAAQARGERVLVCEVTAKERVAGLLGAAESGPEVRRIDERIWSVHVRPAEAMREYALMVLRFRLLYEAVFENRLVRQLLRAIPPLPDIVMLGKVFWHVTAEQDDAGRPRWDRVILDAPATGHGVTFLRTPRSILGLVKAGPMHRDMTRMEAMLLDATVTHVHLVSLPEEMPVNEAVELHGALAQSGFPLGTMFLNGFRESRFSPAELDALAGSKSGDLAGSRLAAALWGERQELSRLYADRLRVEVPLPLVTLPHLFAPSFDRAAVATLSRLVGGEPGDA